MGSFVKGFTGGFKQLLSGDIEEMAKGAANIVSFGSTSVISDEFKPNSKSPKVSADTLALEEDAKKTAKQRKSLFETSGGVKGEEVFGVTNSSRGTIFGN